MGKVTDISPRQDKIRYLVVFDRYDRAKEFAHKLAAMLDATYLMPTNSVVTENLRFDVRVIRTLDDAFRHCTGMTYSDVSYKCIVEPEVANFIRSRIRN